jgi:Zn-finger nucleic acid-binding protein
MSDRQGVEIDYCPECRGVWLDRGELDKIMERSATQELPAVPQRPQQVQQPQVYSNSHDSGHGHGYSHGQKPYRKKSFLEELFD